MCHAQALPADMPTLESIGFTAEADGVALYSVDGKMFNVAGEKESIAEELPVKRMATSKSKKPLREPPMKKVNKPVAKGKADGKRQENGATEKRDRIPTPEPSGAPAGESCITNPEPQSLTIPTVPEKLMDEDVGDGPNLAARELAPPHPATSGTEATDEINKEGAPNPVEIGGRDNTVEQPSSTMPPPSPGMTPPLTPMAHRSSDKSSGDSLATRSPLLSPVISRASSPEPSRTPSLVVDPVALQSNEPLGGEGREREQAEEGDEVEQKWHRKAKGRSDKLDGGEGKESDQAEEGGDVKGKRRRKAKARGDEFDHEGNKKATSKRKWAAEDSDESSASF